MVTGIGGVFFRARDPGAMAAWYHEHLGIETEEGQPWRQEAGPTVFAPFEDATDYFGRRDQQSMLNFRVNDLDAMLAQLRASGVAVDAAIEVMDGNRSIRMGDRSGGQPVRAVGAGTRGARRASSVNASSFPDVLGDLRRRTMEAYRSGDVEAAVALYVETAVQQPPSRPPNEGREAIRASYRELFGYGGLALEMTPWETLEVIPGSEARERGAYRLALGDRVLIAGKYIFIAVRDDGEWRYLWTTVAPD